MSIRFNRDQVELLCRTYYTMHIQTSHGHGYPTQRIHKKKFSMTYVYVTLRTTRKICNYTQSLAVKRQRSNSKITISFYLKHICDYAAYTYEQQHQQTCSKVHNKIPWNHCAPLPPFSLEVFVCDSIEQTSMQYGPQ